MSDKEQFLTKLIGKKIREQRNAISVNQDEFAYKLGIHTNNLGKIERGVNPPGGGTTIIRLITEWGIDVTKIVQEANAEVKRIFSNEGLDFLRTYSEPST
jgi:transcriptional regulator with XRE-family HTH domain